MMHTRLNAALIAVAVAAMPLPAFAQDWGRILTDPNYLPLTGELDGSSAYTYATMNGDTFDGSGAQTDSFRTTVNTLTQTFDYGITDDLALGVSANYIPSERHRADLSGGSSGKTERSGFADPSISLTYRALDERQGPMIVDLLASYSPDFVSAKSATPIDDGTVGRGGQAGYLGVAIGHEWQRFGIRGSALADWDGKRRIDESATASTLHQNSVWNYGFALDSQFRPAERMSVNLGVGYTIRQNYAANDPATASNWTVHPGDVADIHVALNYHFVPNRVVGSLTYRYNAYDHTSDINATPVTLDGKIRGQNENLFGARLAYVLN